MLAANEDHSQNQIIASCQSQCSNWNIATNQSQLQADAYSRPVRSAGKRTQAIVALSLFAPDWLLKSTFALIGWRVVTFITVGSCSSWLACAMRGKTCVNQAKIGLMFVPDWLLKKYLCHDW